jgi:hypothetical protein
MNKLPIDIINIIIPYTYKLQPIDLRKDIISYYKTKNIVINIFIQRNYPLFYIKHILFHLHGFLNGIPNLYSNCNNKLKEDKNRNHILKKNNLLLLKNYNFTNKKLYFIFNTYWGLFTVTERDIFIEIQKNIDNSVLP